MEFEFSNACYVIDTTVNGASYSKIVSSLYSGKIAGQPWLPEYSVPLAIPLSDAQQIKILSDDEVTYPNKMILPFPDNAHKSGEITTLQEFDPVVYSKNSLFPEHAVTLSKAYQARQASFKKLLIAPFQWNPVTRQLIFHKKLRVEVIYGSYIPYEITDDFTRQLLRTGAVNYPEALSFNTTSQKMVKKNETGWLDPTRIYYKIYLNKEGIYQLTYSDLVNAGIPVNTITNTGTIQLYADGKQVPIEVVTASSGEFKQGDYIRFIGNTAPASPYCRMNIYNTSNVYFLTINGDASVSQRFTPGNHNTSISATPQTYYHRMDYYEKDSVFERLGHAPDEKRDFWFWAGIAYDGGTTNPRFVTQFNSPANVIMDSQFVDFRLFLHGMTHYLCNFDHHAIIKINGKKIGEALWNGQTEYMFQTRFKIGSSDIPLQTTNTLEIYLDGVICRPNAADDIRINWFDLSYYSTLKANSNSYQFTSLNNGLSQYTLTAWPGDSIRIYVPETKTIIGNAALLHDTEQKVLFADSAAANTSYYCTDGRNLLHPDSIRNNISSNLHNTTRGADYLIIAHRNFQEVAERLKSLRSVNFPDSTIKNPRISIVYVDEIYNEFSDGLQDPRGIKDFLHYTYESWQAPAPAYVVLIGDMSSDYRHIFPDSRPNFIPSFDVMSVTYGIAASDNSYVSFSDDGIYPFMAIGRISIETVAEGLAFLQKLEQYPADKSKSWRNRVGLFASGVNAADEMSYGFNAASLALRNSYLTPNNINSTCIFNFPGTPEEQLYIGSTAEMRNALDTGMVLLSYYGHGGGFQWDLVFSDSDIYLLTNTRKLPVILSVTCYTAHYDNLDIFGEQFIKVPNKGAVGFFGCSGLTSWDCGSVINTYIFDELFAKKNHVTGKAFMAAKLRSPSDGYWPTQISLLTYLGDPVLSLAIPPNPEYRVGGNDITFNTDSPFIGDTVQISCTIHNDGAVMQDSIRIKLFAVKPDTSILIGTKLIPSFANSYSLTFPWKIVLDGSVTMKLSVNLPMVSIEDDTTNNSATQILNVGDINSPQLIGPAHASTITQTEFTLQMADISGNDFHKFSYYYEIDTSLSFANPIKKSAALHDTGSIISWKISDLPAGAYFWRGRVSDGSKTGQWSPIRALQTGAALATVQKISSSLLKTLETNNAVYTPVSKTLVVKLDSTARGITLPGISTDYAKKFISITVNKNSSGLSDNLLISVEGRALHSTSWTHISTSRKDSVNLSSIDNSIYQQLRFSITVFDSNSTLPQPIEISSIQVNYIPRNELYIYNRELKVSMDTVLNNNPLHATLPIHNLGIGSSDSVAVYYSIDKNAPVLLPEIQKVASHDMTTYSFSLPTSQLATGIHTLNIRIASLDDDILLMNNRIDTTFVVKDDTTRPTVRLLIDNNEVASGDFVPSHPEVFLSIQDDNLLPITSEQAVILVNGTQVLFPGDSVGYSFSTAPKPTTQIRFSPYLQAGTNYIDYRIKDAHGNSSSVDTAFTHLVVQVASGNDIMQVYNYPNPFTNSTAFQFQVAGAEKPNKVTIKIFTVAGRCIRELNIPTETLRIGFNSLHWNGCDADGDAIANGVYLYKVIAEFPGGKKSVLQKLVKMQ
ncbi:MAG: C25 family cysteine peptidase [Ignavibacteria bacterium]|nr:C25 family cysteine peptidase [Ignavibacteria bacterium]